MSLMFKSAANVSPPSAMQERGIVGIVETDRGRCLQISQVSGRYQGICQPAHPFNYPAITVQLAANELINAADTSY